MPDVRNGSVTVAPLLLSAISAALHGVSIAVSPGTTGSIFYKSCGKSRFESLGNCVSDLASKKRTQLGTFASISLKNFTKLKGKT